MLRLLKCWKHSIISSFESSVWRAEESVVIVVAVLFQPASMSVTAGGVTRVGQKHREMVHLNLM